jgi:hypothetical protein
MGPSDFYVRQLFDKFNYIANWFPNANVKLGDIGIMEGYYFKQMGSLEEMNFTFKTRVSDQPIDFSYSWGANFDFTAYEKAKALNNIGEGEFKIRFTGSGSFVFESSNCMVSEIENKITLGQEIKKMYKSGSWDRNWVVIDTLITSESSTILVSSTKDAELELSASVNVPNVFISDNKVGLKVRTQKGELTKYIASKGLSPFFGTSKVKTSFLNQLTFNKNNQKFGGATQEGIAKQYFVDDIWQKSII